MFRKAIFHAKAQGRKVMQDYNLLKEGFHENIYKTSLLLKYSLGL